MPASTLSSAPFLKLYFAFGKVAFHLFTIVESVRRGSTRDRNLEGVHFKTRNSFRNKNGIKGDPTPDLSPTRRNRTTGSNPVRETRRLLRVEEMLYDSLRRYAIREQLAFSLFPRSLPSVRVNADVTLHLFSPIALNSFCGHTKTRDASPVLPPPRVNFETNRVHFPH